MQVVGNSGKKRGAEGRSHEQTPPEQTSFLYCVCTTSCGITYFTLRQTTPPSAHLKIFQQKVKLLAALIT